MTRGQPSSAGDQSRDRRKAGPDRRTPKPARDDDLHVIETFIVEGLPHQEGQFRHSARGIETSHCRQNRHVNHILGCRPMQCGPTSMRLRALTDHHSRGFRRAIAVALVATGEPMFQTGCGSAPHETTLPDSVLPRRFSSRVSDMPRLLQRRLRHHGIFRPGK